MVPLLQDLLFPILGAVVALYIIFIFIHIIYLYLYLFSHINCAFAARFALSNIGLRFWHYTFTTNCVFRLSLRRWDFEEKNMARDLTWQRCDFRYVEEWEKTAFSNAFCYLFCSPRSYGKFYISFKQNMKKQEKRGWII